MIDDNQELTNGRKIAQHFSSYGIFQPNTMTLRGTIPDPNQTTPIGLNGGRLAEAIKILIHEEDDELYFGNLYMDDLLDMIDWASDISVDAPKKSNINANIPTTRQIIEFTDRYMKENSQSTVDPEPGQRLTFIYQFLRYKNSIDLCVPIVITIYCKQANIIISQIKPI